MVAFSKRPSGGTEQPGPNRLLLHGLDLEGPEEVLPGPDGTEAAAGLLEATDVRLQRQALGALVALEDATCSSAGAVAVLMLDVSHMMQEPSMKHQKLPRHPARLPSSLDPLVQGSEKMSQVGISLHQPKNATVESLFQNGNCQLVPCELVRHRKQAHKFPKVGYVLLAPHLLVLHEEAQLLLDGIVEAGTPAFEQEPRLSV